MCLKGSFPTPGDKSISHRVALMSLLAGGNCRVSNLSPCADVTSSLEAIDLLGGRYRAEGEDVVITGAAGRISDRARIDCGNSGTSIRLLMGILAGQRGDFTLDGDESLQKRPMERVAAPLRSMGAEVNCENGCCPVNIRGGGLRGIDYELPVASAQLKSAVLLAGLQAEGPTVVHESKASRDHTERLIPLWGGLVTRQGDGWRVEKSDLSLPETLFVPGDPSSAAFFLCSAAVIPESDVTAEGVLLNPTRTGFLEVLKRMGAAVEVETLGRSPEPWGRIRVRFSPDLTGCEVRSEEIPALVDEVPILALTATQARGVTRFHDVGELRLKETDRLTAIVTQLDRLGAVVGLDGDILIIEGPTPLKKAEELNSFNDHRIAMTLKLAGLMAGNEPFIQGEESIRISYPGFDADLGKLRS